MICILPFNYDGKHYRLKETRFYPPPPPIQQPRIPIWVVGAWPRMKSMQRVVRYDGLLPTVMDDKGGHHKVTPEQLRDMKAFIDANRTATTPFDIVIEGTTLGGARKKAAVTVRKWADAGATWWIEAMWNTIDKRDGLKTARKRIEQGPPA